MGILRNGACSFSIKNVEVRLKLSKQCQYLKTGRKVRGKRQCIQLLARLFC